MRLLPMLALLAWRNLWRNRRRTLIMLAAIVLGIWFLMQFVSAAATPTGEGGVAFWAHVGGFVAGMALVFVFKRRDIGIWQPPHSRAFELERPRGPWGL